MTAVVEVRESAARQNLAVRLQRDRIDRSSSARSDIEVSVKAAGPEVIINDDSDAHRFNERYSATHAGEANSETFVALNFLILIDRNYDRFCGVGLLAVTALRGSR